MEPYDVPFDLFRRRITSQSHSSHLNQAIFKCRRRKNITMLQPFVFNDHSSTHNLTFSCPALAGRKMVLGMLFSGWEAKNFGIQNNRGPPGIMSMEYYVTVIWRPQSGHPWVSLRPKRLNVKRGAKDEDIHAIYSSIHLPLNSKYRLCHEEERMLKRGRRVDVGVW